MRITDFLIMNSLGEQIEADPHGNNLAFKCELCDHPILAIALENHRGSDEDHPAICKGCGRKYFLDIRPRAEKLYIHDL